MTQTSALAWESELCDKTLDLRGELRGQKTDAHQPPGLRFVFEVFANWIQIIEMYQVKKRKSWHLVTMTAVTPHSRCPFTNAMLQNGTLTSHLPSARHHSSTISAWCFSPQRNNNNFVSSEKPFLISPKYFIVI
jgi:hypothetical protein